MAIIKSNALLLRKTPFRNSSLVLDVLTEEQGRVSLIAKGAKKEKSPFYTRLDYLEFLEIVFIRKPVGMGILTECTVKDVFRGIRNDAARMKYGLLFFRLLRELCTETEPDHQLFRMCVDFLQGISQVRQDNIRIYYLYALLRLIESEGYSPEVHVCPECGTRISGEAVLERGTCKTLCKACFGQKKGKKRLELSMNSITIIRLFKNRDISGVFRNKPGNAVIDEVETFLLLFLSSVLNKDITAHNTGTFNEL